MRIFYAAGASPNAFDISESRLWERNLHDTLAGMGHEVVKFGGDVTGHFTAFRNYRHDPEEQARFLEYRERMQSELLREVEEQHRKKPIDLFFSYFWSEICEPGTVENIKALGITTVNWFCNASYQFHLVRDLAPRYDWCLVPERFRLGDYIEAGARPIYCQEAANPEVYKPCDLPKEFDVTFVGQAYGDRPSYVKFLLDRKIDVRVWGNGWTRFAPGAREPGTRGLARVSHVARRLLTPDGRRAAGRRILRKLGLPDGGDVGDASGLEWVHELPPGVLGGILPDEEMIRMFSRSRINLGFSTCGNTREETDRVVQVRLRDFEVPMSGGFYMVEYMQELEEFFDVGREIVCYEGPEDLVEKIRYYLAHEGEREAIRKAGHERALRDHTWKRRFEKAFREMGLA